MTPAKHRAGGVEAIEWDPTARSLDFNLADFDTVALLTPVTRAAEEWVAHHLPGDLIRWGGGVAIDVRNVAHVVQRIAECGLIVETG